MNSYEIQACNEMHIDTPGTIQGHGTMLIFDKLGTITAAAQNTSVFDLPEAKALLGKNISRAIGEQTADLILDAIAAKRFRVLNAFTVHTNNKALAASVTPNSQGLYILELEPDSHPTHDLITDTSALIAELSHNEEITQSLNSACQLLYELTGYQRVMAYKFDEDLNGQVIAESKDPDIETFLGLSYPSSDIPKPARKSLAAAGIRVVASSSAAPVPLLTNAEDYPTDSLDLAPASLRGIASIHVTYLKNMGIEASMSLAIHNQKNELWGLIICHNNNPRPIPPSQRRAATVISKLISNHVMLEQGRKTTSAFTYAHTAARNLLKSLAEHHSDPISLLVNNEVSLRSVIKADGLAIVNGSTLSSIGDCPSEHEALALKDWLQGRQDPHEVFTTPALGQHFTTSGQLGSELAGLLAFPIDSRATTYALFFKRQNLRSIRWAGDPKKVSSKDAADLALHQPRDSFDPWHQTIKGFAHPWTEEETAVATFMMHALKPAFDKAQANGMAQSQAPLQERA